MKKFLNDFKAFINRGNVMDMAVGIIIGAAFGKIVSSLVADLIMPLITAAVGANSLTDLSVTITKDVVLSYGNFIQTIIDFLIIAFVVFLLIRSLNAAKNFGGEATKKLKKKIHKDLKIAETEEEVKEEIIEEVPAEPAKPTVEELLTQIKELLEKQAAKE